MPPRAEWTLGRRMVSAQFLPANDLDRLTGEYHCRLGIGEMGSRISLPKYAHEVSGGGKRRNLPAIQYLAHSDTIGGSIIWTK